MTEAHQGIDATDRRFDAAFETGDPGRPAQEVYTREPRVLPPGSPLIRGREGIIGFWQAAARQFGIQKLKLSTVDLDVRGEHAHEIGQPMLTLAGGLEVVAKYVVNW